MRAKMLGYERPLLTHLPAVNRMLSYSAVLYGAAESMGYEFEPSVVERAQSVGNWVFDALLMTPGKEERCMHPDAVPAVYCEAQNSPSTVVCAELLPLGWKASMKPKIVQKDLLEVGAHGLGYTPYIRGSVSPACWSTVSALRSMEGQQCCYVAGHSSRTWTASTSRTRSGKACWRV
jgi:hypothetical protein